MAIARAPLHPYTFSVAERPTRSGPQPRSPARGAPAGDDARTRVAGSSRPGGPVQKDALPSHLLRSGEIEPRNRVAPSLPTGDWEEKTVVDDSQLNDPKEALSGLSFGNGGDEEFTIDEPQRPMPFPMGPATATPKQTVHGQAPPPSQNAGQNAGQNTGDKLVVIAGNDRGREFPLAGKPITVGRGIDNDVVLTDIAVSRKHLSIEHDGTRYKIVDAGSGNGTLVNDEVQTGTRPLRHGDRIEIGNTVFRFEQPSGAGGQGSGPEALVAPRPAGGGRPAAAPGPAAAPLPGPGAQNRPHLPPPRDEAGPPGAHMPASAPEALLSSPAGAATPGALSSLPPHQQAPGSAAPPSSAAPVAMARAPLPATPGRPRATALAGVQATPRNTMIGAISALVGIAALAAVGMFLGDDEYLAAEHASAASFELPTLSMLQGMIASSALLGGVMPEEAAVFEESAVPTTIVPAPEGEGDQEDDGTSAEENAVAPSIEGEGDGTGDAGIE